MKPATVTKLRAKFCLIDFPYWLFRLFSTGKMETGYSGQSYGDSFTHLNNSRPGFRMHPQFLADLSDDSYVLPRRLYSTISPKIALKIGMTFQLKSSAQKLCSKALLKSPSKSLSKNLTRKPPSCSWNYLE